MIFFYISVGASNNTIFAPIDVHGLINVHNQILVLKMLKFSEKMSASYKHPLETIIKTNVMQ